MHNNTRDYIPIESISCNLLVQQNNEEYPFINGTGFFVQFQPYDHIFYITAKHCFSGINITNQEIMQSLKVPYKPCGAKPADQTILFCEVLAGWHKDDDEDNGNDDKYEDILAFVVDRNVGKANMELLKKRALKLPNQNEIDDLLKDLSKKDEDIYTAGFPKQFQSIDYDTDYFNVEPRAYFGKIRDNCSQKQRYGFEKATWKEKDYNGFSGSPVFTQTLNEHEKNIAVTLIGIVLTATTYRGEFLSINFVTDLIENYIKETEDCSNDNKQ